ncbi:hypothetical protein GHT07_07255 [Caenimonas koreensis DSM 17982]|uniref:Uncharacterized protein n=1 Tax=Caenimonas koreensis DSM 17982 TaxID=1121255 RepID=A0A844ARQ0_9BURK|nr:hypothetical protein [Caenimonas koreensis]MRD47070.1 hypothetical protein [Caenimonas koreensis DSM 17982]
MASRPRNVDLGPLYLQVGEEDASQGWTPPASGADSNDVARFQALLHKGRERHQQTDTTPEAQLWAVNAPEPQELANTDDVAAEIAHLWVGVGTSSAREVRVGLRATLLADTSVRLYEAQGELRVEFSCGTNRAALWLQRKLPVLAKEVGQRLQRPLELSVRMSDGTLAASCRWSNDARDGEQA